MPGIKKCKYLHKQYVVLNKVPVNGQSLLNSVTTQCRGNHNQAIKFGNPTVRY